MVESPFQGLRSICTLQDARAGRIVNLILCPLPSGDEVAGRCGDMLRSLFRLIVGPLLLLAGCAAPGGLSARSADFTFQTDGGYVFDARVHLPPPEQRNGYGVLLMGGGIANDLNWTVPGSLRMGDRVQQVTISGEPHEDATRIAESLVERGYVVAHWSTIRRDDPKRDKWPYEATTYPILVMIEHARAALRAFRNRRLFDENRPVLLGYSLGGHRAVVIASTDRGIAELVLLAPAQFTRTGPDDGGRNVHREQVQGLMLAIDLDGDGESSRDEFETWSATASPAEALGALRFDDLDFDDGRGLVPWELSAALARSSRRDMSIPEDLPTDRHGLRWPEDILGERTKKAAVTKALQEYVARREQKRLAELFGSLEWDANYDYKTVRSRN